MRTASSQPHSHQHKPQETQCCFHGLIARGSESAGKALRSSHAHYKLTTTLTPTQTSRDSVLLSWSHCPRLRISGESFEIITCTLQAHNHTHTNKPQETQCCFHGLIARGSESAGKALRSSHAHYKLTTTLTPTQTSRDSVLLSWSHCPRLRISGESFEIITCTLQAHNHTHTNTNLKRLSVAFMVSLPAAQNQRGKL